MDWIRDINFLIYSGLLNQLYEHWFDLHWHAKEEKKKQLWYSCLGAKWMNIKLVNNYIKLFKRALNGLTPYLWLANIHIKDLVHVKLMTPSLIIDHNNPIIKRIKTHNRLWDLILRDEGPHTTKHTNVACWTLLIWSHCKHPTRIKILFWQRD